MYCNFAPQSNRKSTLIIWIYNQQVLNLRASVFFRTFARNNIVNNIIK